MNRIPKLLKFVAPALLGTAMALSATAPARAFLCEKNGDYLCVLKCGPILGLPIGYGICV